MSRNPPLNPAENCLKAFDDGHTAFRSWGDGHAPHLLTLAFRAGVGPKFSKHNTDASRLFC